VAGGWPEVWGVFRSPQMIRFLKMNFPLSRRLRASGIMLLLAGDYAAGRTSNQTFGAPIVVAKASGSGPSLAVGSIPALMFERRKVIAPALARQLRLDVDQGIERIGPELSPVPLAHSGAGASILGAGPVIAGVEETVARLESVSRGGSGPASGDRAGDAARRVDEVRIIPDDTKRREQFRAVSSFFDPPTVKGSPPAAPATSSATYEQR